ncbi:MAG TPA: substrate-binding domain-containing protein [Nitrososphaera sp.]|nr:substrate-binding domain-containing protein [Nitrososphaera sp.]
MSKKKKGVISLLVLLSLALVIVVVAMYLLTPFFQPRSGPSSDHDEAENTPIVTNHNISNQTGVTNMIPTTIDIVSSSSAFPFVQRWVAQYENQQLASSVDLNVDYLTDEEIIAAEGGGTSRRDLAIVGLVEQKNSSILYVPLSAQAVAIVYNIPSFPDIPSGLRLNSTMLLSIFNGSITQWDDAAIKELNPSLNLPHERIVVVHTEEDDTNQSSNSSSQLLLDQYFGLHSLSWPKNDTITTQGPAELAETVRKIPYSIGYVDFSYAVQTKMTYAAIGAADGNYSVPSMQSIARAVDVALQFYNSSTDGSSPSSSISSIQQKQQQQQLPPTINTSRIVSDAYPIVGLYYASLLANDSTDDNSDKIEEQRVNAMVIDFVEWLMSETGGQQTLLEVQYPPIYSNNEKLATYAMTTMDKIENSLTR